MTVRARRSALTAVLWAMCIGAGLATAQAAPPPDTPGPLATDLSPALHSKAIHAAVRRVADWQREHLAAQPGDRSRNFGVLATGLMSAAHTLGDGKLSSPVLATGEQFHWTIEHTVRNPADNFALAQAYLDACRDAHDPAMIAPLRRRLDIDLEVPFDPNTPLWQSAEELFMEPPAAMQISEITGDAIYEDFVNREWGRTRKLLYDPQRHLYARDAAALKLLEKNGQKHFDAQANGWAMAGLARLLAVLPSDDPLRSYYIGQFREMAAAIAATQSNDGLWRPTLLDASSSPLPDTAASSLLAYALAWGVHHHQLDADAYLPVVELAWKGLLTHIYADGRLGCMQTEAGIRPESSTTFGVGAFLLAGGEVDALSQHKRW